MKTNPITKSLHLLPAAVAIALLGASPAHASILFTIESVGATSPSTDNSFEVDLTNTGGDVTIDAFSFGLMVGTTDITFTSATIDTTVNPYIFAGNSLFGPVISTTSPGQTVLASDLWGGAGDGFTVGAGTSVGLGEVFFDVGPGASPGPDTVSFVSADDSLSDIDGDPIPIDGESSGTITVAGGTSTTPEPSTLLLLSLPLALLVWTRKRHS
ncbi:MAG TPA: PEP-CTERM sorting domain-containing protein [Bryobacteraceae bacterium]|jgi:hypothetical protein